MCTLANQVLDLRSVSMLHKRWNNLRIGTTPDPSSLVKGLARQTTRPHGALGNYLMSHEKLIINELGPKLREDARDPAGD